MIYNHPVWEATCLIFKRYPNTKYTYVARCLFDIYYDHLATDKTFYLQKRNNLCLGRGSIHLKKNL